MHVMKGFRLLWIGMVILTACSRGTMSSVWQTSFDDAEAWRIHSDAAAELKIDEGRLSIHILQPGQVAWAAVEHSFTDFKLQVEATQLAGPPDNEYGVLLRMDDDARFYAFSVSGDGYVRASRYEDGRWEVLGPDWTAHEAVRQGAATNVLVVEARGPHFTFWVNEEQVLDVEDDTLSRGEIGLYAGAFDEAGVNISFDNLYIEPLH
ncbi:MAG: family 16 glycoside hydrolase [Anaerolineae bacterium]